MNFGRIIRLVKESSSIFQHHPKRNYDIQLMSRWLMNSFNKYDPQRVKEVGRNRACAEWLLKNGAHVVFEGTEMKVTDFNKLASGVFDNYRISRIYAEDSSISHVGFEYLKGQEDAIELISLINCKYIQDEAVKYFADNMTNLKVFDIRNCYLVTFDGLKYMAKRESLEKMIVCESSQMMDLDELTKYMKSHLPNCKLDCNPNYAHNPHS